MPSVPFDRASLWDRVNNDMELLRDLLQIFRQEYPGMLQKLGTAIETRNCADIAKYGHKVKGSALQFSAPGAAATASRLEKMGQSGSLEGVTEAYEQLKAEVASLVEELRLMTNGKGTVT
ncbi:MAG: Hpt domain-containing protein [Acidobacteriia bacterium]|nr:Hpt domain-containing protein [Terriglobia bacterium]